MPDPVDPRDHASRRPERRTIRWWAVPPADDPLAQRRLAEQILGWAREQQRLQQVHPGDPNPYRTVDVPPSCDEHPLTLLPLEDVREWCRRESWAARHHPAPRIRWIHSRRLATGCRELVRRGEPGDSWHDGTAEGTGR